MVFFTTLANAQTHRFDVTLLRPAPNFTVTAGGTYAIGDTVRVILSQGSLTTNDTIGLSTPDGTSIYYFTAAQAQGDTVYLTKQDTITFNTNVGTYDYCVRAYLFDRAQTDFVSPNFDTNGHRSCSAFTLQGWPSSTEEFTRVEKDRTLKLKLYPNPVVGNIVNLDYIAQNASEVEVNVFDISGRKVLNKSFGQAFKGQEGYGLDISELNIGMYILELRQDGIKATGQFVK